MGFRGVSTVSTSTFVVCTSESKGSTRWCELLIICHLRLSRWTTLKKNSKGGLKENVWQTSQEL